MNFLKGRKTYICAFLAMLATGAQLLGWISAEEFTSIMGLLGAGGLAALRAGVGK